MAPYSAPMLITTNLWAGYDHAAVMLAHGVVLLIALWRVPWRQLIAVSTHSHLLFGAVLGLVLLWQMGAEVEPVFRVHLLGMTTVTLVLGAPLAIVAGTAASLAMAVLGKLAYAQVMAHALINVTVPVLITAGALQLVMRFGPRNIFMYMLGVGFFAGGLSMLGAVLATLLFFSEADLNGLLQGDQAALVLMVMFSEGFFNGGIITVLAVYQPHWLKTFDDRHFLDGP